MWISLEDVKPTRQNTVRKAIINSDDVSAIVADEIYENCCNIVLKNGEKLFCGLSVENFFGCIWTSKTLVGIVWDGQNLVKRKK